MSAPADDDWARDTLPNASPALQQLLRSAVCDGGWFLDRVTCWSFTIRRALTDRDWPTEMEEITVYMTGGRYTGAQRSRVVPDGRVRRVDDCQDWIDAPQPLALRRADEATS